VIKQPSPPPKTGIQTSSRFKNQGQDFPWRGLLSPQGIWHQLRSSVPFLVQTSSTDCNQSDTDLEPLMQRLKQLDFGDSTIDVKTYWQICLAARHASLDSWIPIDFDSRMLRYLLVSVNDPELSATLVDQLLHSLRWQTDPYSRRVFGGVSAHQMETVGNLLACMPVIWRLASATSRPIACQQLDQSVVAIEETLRTLATRVEACQERPGAELNLLQLASILAPVRNLLESEFRRWPLVPPLLAIRDHLSGFVKQTTPALGSFATVERIFRQILLPESHPHFPLRKVPEIRAFNDLLPPFAPFFGSWGQRLGLHEGLSVESRRKVLAALIHGCRLMPKQQSYVRAINGIRQATGRRQFDFWIRFMEPSVREFWRDSDLAERCEKKEQFFEESLQKQVLLASRC
jgi:hypothetical protein